MTRQPPAERPGLRVRPAEPPDAEAVVRIRTRAWQTAYAGIMPAAVLAALDGEAPERVRRAREAWSSPQPSPFRTLVAGDPKVRGFATCGPYRLDDGTGAVDPAAGEVLLIYVDPDHQGRGAGTALMDAAVAGLREDGCGEVRLWVLEENAPARRFYHRYGFVADGERHLFQVRPPDGPPVDLPEVRYTLRL
jgi:ribosomal protein S18 acetylase RimI-like enzyme